MLISFCRVFDTFPTLPSAFARSGKVAGSDTPITATKRLHAEAHHHQTNLDHATSPGRACLAIDRATETSKLCIGKSMNWQNK